MDYFDTCTVVIPLGDLGVKVMDLEIMSYISCIQCFCFKRINPIALRKAKIVYEFGLSECNRIKEKSLK